MSKQRQMWPNYAQEKPLCSVDSIVDEIIPTVEKGRLDNIYVWKETVHPFRKANLGNETGTTLAVHTDLKEDILKQETVILSLSMQTSN